MGGRQMGVVRHGARVMVGDHAQAILMQIGFLTAPQHGNLAGDDVVPDAAFHFNQLSALNGLGENP